ncbi:unnamed protein product [Mesocestoides corti]|uniref:LRRCT domain-containing protein n=1 Tax=Mesocestoides corti TaxID=53468 RepID=A0A158QTU4_MESCO|nr:unnamed protein product [Mesocestoides corti]
MTFIFLLVYLGLSHICTTGAQMVQHGRCYKSSSVLICKNSMPTVDDLQFQDIQTVIMTHLSEGTWLYLNDSNPTTTGIQKVEVQSSDIFRVEPGYFAKISGTNKLKRLMLRNVKGSVVVDKSMLQGLAKSLNYLVVVNSLSVKVADLAELEVLTDLELSSTNVIGTPADFEKLLPRLRSLDIKNCNLNQLPWEAIVKWITENDSRRLKINGNSWICDCSIAALKRLQPGIVGSNLQKLTCGSPPNLAGRLLSDITEEELCPVAPPSKNDSAGGSLQPSGNGSGSEDGAGNAINPSMGNKGEVADVKSSGVRTEVIIAGTVVGALVLIFVVFIIVYKCRLYPKKKNREERTSKTHQNKRYVYVIADSISV